VRVEIRAIGQLCEQTKGDSQTHRLTQRRRLASKLIKTHRSLRFKKLLNRDRHRVKELHFETLKPCCFEIDGYTDAIGGSEYNQKLSEERAKSVIDYLGSHGIERERMMPKGFGKTHAIASNTTEEGRQKNRRLQVVNLGYGHMGAKD
jgi:hypothetical protein